MFNIGVLTTGKETTYEQDAYIHQFEKLTFQMYRLSQQEILNEAPTMDALIIEDNLAAGLKYTCELIMQIRKSCKALIWIASKSLTKTSKTIYLQLGADGVFDWEDEQEESLLQLSNILSRLGNDERVIQKELGESSLKLNPNNFSVLIEGKETCLTKLEFQAIAFLSQYAGQAITYEEIYENIWKDELGEKEIKNKQYRVSNLIFHLRKKLEDNPAQPKYIKTIRSKGYMLAIEIND